MLLDAGLVGCHDHDLVKNVSINVFKWMHICSSIMLCIIIINRILSVSNTSEHYHYLNLQKYNFVLILMDLQTHILPNKNISGLLFPIKYYYFSFIAIFKDWVGSFSRVWIIAVNGDGERVEILVAASNTQ